MMIRMFVDFDGESFLQYSIHKDSVGLVWRRVEQVSYYDATEEADRKARARIKPESKKKET